jgi:hypothetical protein
MLCINTFFAATLARLAAFFLKLLDYIVHEAPSLLPAKSNANALTLARSKEL